MTGTEIILLAYLFMLAVFVGFETISKVPPILHTPLMSGTNAIHGIILVGAIAMAGSAVSRFEQTIGFLAVVFAAMNVLGGFAVTDRMLQMFKKAKQNSEASGTVHGGTVPDRQNAKP